MVKRRRTGLPKESGVQKKVNEITNSGLGILDNPSNVLEVDPGFEQGHEAGTCMPRKRGRGRPKGSTVQKKVEKITDSGLDIPDNPSNVLNHPIFEEVHDAGDTTFSAASCDIEVNLSELYSPLPPELHKVLIPFLASNPIMLLSTHPGHRGPAYMVLGEFLLFVGSHSLWALANDQRGKFLILLNALSNFSFDAAWLEKVKAKIVSPSQDSPLHAFSLVYAGKERVCAEIERLSSEAARLSKVLEETGRALFECMAKAKAFEQEESSLRSHLDAPFKL